MRFPDATVISIRERVFSGTHPEQIANELGYNVSLIWRVARGETYRNLGGPITQRIRRHVGRRRSCLRCRQHKDEPSFAHVRDAKTGICKACERPEDRFPHIHDRAARLRVRQAEAIARMQPDLERLRTEPLFGEPLPPEERARIRTEVTRRLWA